MKEFFKVVLKIESEELKFWTRGYILSYADSNGLSDDLMNIAEEEENTVSASFSCEKEKLVDLVTRLKSYGGIEADLFVYYGSYNHKVNINKNFS